MKIEDLFKKITDFFYGEINYGEDDLGFILELEDRVLNLKNGEKIRYYLDYTASGEIYEMITSYEKKIGHGIHAGTMQNKRGIRIGRNNNRIEVEIKDGYGKNWDYYYCTVA